MKRASASKPAIRAVRRSSSGWNSGVDGAVALEQPEDLGALLLGAAEPGHPLGARRRARSPSARSSAAASASVGVEDLVAALAVALGRVHRDVGVAQQVLDDAVADLADRDADARLHVERLAGDLERLAHGGEHALGDLDRLRALADALEQDPELVAAEAGRGVAGAQAAAQALGDLDEQLVAGGVAERVVDRLEVVEVEHADGDEVALAGGAVQGVLDAVVEERAVRQLGERVVEGAVAQLGLGGLALGDVAAGEDDAADVRVVAHVGDRGLDVDVAGRRCACRRHSTRRALDARRRAAR